MYLMASSRLRPQRVPAWSSSDLFPTWLYGFLRAEALFRSRARKQAVKVLRKHKTSNRLALVAHAQLTAQPTLCHLPVPLRRIYGDLEHLGDFFQAQTAEKTQL